MSVDAIATPVELKRQVLRKHAIRHLYLKGARTVAEIGNKLHISTPTTLSLLAELMAEGIITKRGRGESIGGRKPDLYGLRERALYVLAIDMGRYATQLAVFDCANHLQAPVRSLELDVSTGLHTLDNLFARASTLLQEAGVPANAWLGVGVSMTGLVSAKDGHNHTYFAGGAHLSLKDDLARYFGKPVYVQNDVKSAALAEYRFGLAKDQSNALVLSMDWGLGLGIIMDGKLRRGADGFAGEFGHIPLMEYGLLCHCGKTGCLETVASGLALSREALQGLRTGQRTLLREQFAPNTNRIPLEAIVRAAVQGDQFSIQLLADSGRHLGKGIAILIQLLNPSRIVLTGEIAKADQYITVPLQQAINTHCMSQLSQSVRIELSQLGNQARLLGAVATVIENVFDS